MHYIVYKITNKMNGKYYIGKHQTENIHDGYMGSGKLISRAISKYGIENFSKEVLHVFETEDEMNDKEREAVVVSEETYNLCEGGKGGGFSYINRNLEMVAKRDKIEHKRAGYAAAKIHMTDREKNSMAGAKSAKMKVGIHNPNFKRTHWIGRKHSEDTKKKMSIAAKNRGK